MFRIVIEQMSQVSLIHSLHNVKKNARMQCVRACVGSIALGDLSYFWQNLFSILLTSESSKQDIENGYFRGIVLSRRRISSFLSHSIGGQHVKQEEKKEKKTNEHSFGLLRTSLKANENAAKTQKINR